ncbi:MAG TPA: TAXI family TRAP transporter solute-binding subunit [Candidatus Binatia bacterium]
MDFKIPHFPPSITRSRLVLEVASEMVGKKEFPYRQARLSLREQGPGEWNVHMFGSDTPDAIDEVARGEADIAIINPAGPLSLALRGTGPYKEPIPLRAITVIPSLDQFVFAVHERTGLKSLSDLKERRYPLKVSLRDQRNHSDHFHIRQVFTELGFSLEDINAWGGTVRYDEGIPGASRIGIVERGEADAIFDEAVDSWAGRALDLGMRFLPLEEPLLKRLEAMGFRRAAVKKADYPKLPADVWTLDFSGWPVFTRADVPDSVISCFCAALEARKGAVPWQGEGPLPLERMCRDSADTPLDIPLHPAAERYWRERGYLS